MIVFKRATNPCLIGRDVLAIYPTTQDHFLAMMGLKKPYIPTTLLINNNGEKEELPLECKDTEIKHRAPYKTKIENSVERKCIIRSSIESEYVCGHDHYCTANQQQVNSVDYAKTPATPPAEIILIRALDILLEETNTALDESIAEHESAKINQEATITTPKTPKSRQQVCHSELTSSLMEKLIIDSKKSKRIHRTKSPSGRRLNLSSADELGTRSELTSSLIEESEPENEFNYSESRINSE